MGIDKDKNISAATGLRIKAEEHLKAKKPGVVFVGTDVETQRLLHELEIHQIELEMQNAELRQSRDDAEKSLEKYSDFYEFAPVGYFTLNLNGAITSVNLRGASLVGVARPRLLGQRFGLLVTDGHRQIFTDFLDELFINRDKTACEVALTSRENRPLFVQLEAMASISGQECGLAMIDITERKQAENDLRNYASRLIEMEEELRNKLATELHDEICRDLTVLGMNLAIIGDGMTGLAPKKLIERVKVSRKLTKEISHTARNIMVDLRPSELSDFGLLTTLRLFTDQFSKHTGIEISVQAVESFPRFKVEKETALFRIAQEALINAAKYAATQIVTIKLWRADDKIWLAVVDEGNGFLSASPSQIKNSSGWGMRIMRERTELMGGNFHVDSTPGKGTTVSVVMPLEDI
jgi:PAS domain S-box-containing protein